MKTAFTFLSKTYLSEHTWEVKLSSEDSLNYTPGQFVSLEILPQTNRSYSIVALENAGGKLNPPPTILTLIVKGTPSGPTEHWIDTVQVGDTFSAFIPMGRFSLHPTPAKKIFIAIGTGLAPFIPMIYQQLAIDPQTQIDLIYGVKAEKDDYSLKYFQEILEASPNLHLTLCVSQQPEQMEQHKPYTFFAGRVTDYLTSITVDTEADYYLCGNPLMVQEVQEMLEQAGIARIYTEKFHTLITKK
jgi:all-trans-retinol 13,14-reductase